VIADRIAQLKQANPNLILSDPARDENVLEVIEEDLQVDKTAVERGRMRIYSVVTEREVSQNVALRDETLRVTRRPVNRQVEIRPDLFQERSYEMVEMDEIALVGKTARVVEEIVLGKEVAEKIETIKETLRRQDVEIEEVPAVRPFDDYDADFRAFYNEKLASKGVQYDELRPALNYGYSLATREPFRSSPWSVVEKDARRIWEEKNPGTWDQSKAVIHYAWEKVRSAR
jgi:stress response protein YsnF